MSSAFAHPVTLAITIAVTSLLALAPLGFAVLPAKPELRRELRTRWLSWVVMAPVLIAPILLGRVATIVLVAGLSLACYRELARATGLFRERLLSGLVVLGILAVAATALASWYGMFVALAPLSMCAIFGLAILADRPQGYIQRTALAAIAFLLCGHCLGHLSHLANDRDARPILLALILCVEMNDVFAFCCGKLLGRRKLLPQTSPNKTLAGALGALVLTTALFACVGHFVFAGSALDTPRHLLLMGALLSLSGQAGDLVLSSIKRDLGIKDMAATIPGHGGVLDRMNSMLLAAPAMFHYLHYVRGIGP